MSSSTVEEPLPPAWGSFGCVHGESRSDRPAVLAGSIPTSRFDERNEPTKYYNAPLRIPVAGHFLVTVV